MKNMQLTIILSIFFVLMQSHLVVAQTNTSPIPIKSFSKELTFIANDTLKKRYFDQRDYWKSRNYKIYENSTPLFAKYEWSELEVVSLPLFDLNINGTNYSCTDTIENYINFNNDYKKQIVLIIKDNEVICHFYLPNESMLDIDIQYYGDYESELSRMINRISPDIYSKVLNNKGDYFYFQLVGMYALMELDFKSGVINVYNLMTLEKLTINQYVRKEVGAQLIQWYAQKKYSQMDVEPEFEFTNCGEVNITEKKFKYILVN